MVRRVNAMGRDGTYGQGWRRVQRLILMIEDPASKARVSPIWANPETRIETQDADVHTKLAPSLGARTVAEKVLGWSPEEAERGVAEASETAAQRDPLGFNLKTGAFGAGSGS